MNNLTVIENELVPVYETSMRFWELKVDIESGLIGDC